MKYTLTLNEHQAEVIQRACERYMRLCIGQLEYVTDVTIWGEAEPKEGHAIEANRIRTYTDILKFEMFGFQPNESWGVGQAPAKAKTAYDIEQVIRHRLAWDLRPPKDDNTMLNITYDTPIQYGAHKLPRMEPVTDCDNHKPYPKGE